MSNLGYPLCGSASFVASMALAAASTTAMAQTSGQGISSVTLYGVMDEYVAIIKPEGLHSQKRLDSSGLLASRVGIRGKEDLGDGLAANFLLESGLNADLGAQADGNRMWNRQSYVGFSSPAGEIRLGRQNTPQFYMNGKFDAFGGATFASGFNNITGTAPRVDRAVGVFTPRWSDITAQALFARGALAGAPIADQISANQNIHIALEYEPKNFYAGVNWESVKAVALPGLIAHRFGAGTSYAINDKWRVYGAFGKETRSDNAIDLKLYTVSALWTITPLATLAFGWTHVTDGVTGPGHGGADQPGLLARYFFSKRTSIYSGLARLKQHDLRTSFSLGGAAVVAAGARPTTPVPGGSINGAQVGIVHTF